METSVKQGEYAEQTPEQKQYKETKDRFREEIKFLVALQKRTKDNRKVETKDERVYDQHIAQSAVENNAFSLRHHYIAYGFFRGRQIEKIESPSLHRANTSGYDKKGFKIYDKEVVKKLTEKYAAGTTIHYNAK